MLKELDSALIIKNILITTFLLQVQILNFVYFLSLYLSTIFILAIYGPRALESLLIAFYVKYFTPGVLVRIN